MNSDTINWGIVGLGKIAHKFAQDLFLVPGARLHAVASRNPDKASAFRARYGADFSYGSYEDILKAPYLDAVYIATPHVLHCANTLFFLDQGIPVLCEKPFAMNREEVIRMIEMAQKQNTFLMEAMWTRFFPLTDKILEIAHAGQLGALCTVKADFGFHAAFEPDGRIFNRALGGGSVLDVGIYPLFLSLLLLGKPQDVVAHASFSPTGVDESCAIILKYPENRMALLYSSIQTKTAVEAEVFGSEGCLKIQSRFHHPREISWGKYYAEQHVLQMPYPGNGYQYEIAEVGRCLKEGKKESSRMPLSMSLDLINLLDEVRRVAGITYD